MLSCGWGCTCPAVQHSMRSTNRNTALSMSANKRIPLPKTDACADRKAAYGKRKCYLGQLIGTDFQQKPSVPYPGHPIKILHLKSFNQNAAFYWINPVGAQKHLKGSPVGLPYVRLWPHSLVQIWYIMIKPETGMRRWQKVSGDICRYTT